MISSAPLTDGWVVAAVAGARRRLGDICETLLVLRRQCHALADQTRWESGAAAEFRTETDALADEVASLAAEVEGIDEQLRSVAALAVPAAGSWRP